VEKASAGLVDEEMQFFRLYIGTCKFAKILYLGQDRTFYPSFVQPEVAHYTSRKSET
jgi:hypothetical protein